MQQANQIVSEYVHNVGRIGKINKVCRPKVVTSAYISVRPIVTVVVIYECAIVEAIRIILEVCTINKYDIFMKNKPYNQLPLMCTARSVNSRIYKLKCMFL